jgi:ferric-dicitrate binding protein FerR (iron transport regulator)
MMMVDDTMDEFRKQAAPAQEPATQEPRGIKLTEEQLRARRARSIAIALALGAFVAVIFAVTIVRLGSNVLTGPDYMRPVQTTR